MTVRYLHNAAGQRVFSSEPAGELAVPNSEALGTGFVDWLKRRFGWLFTPAQADALLGTVYLYGDGELPAWALLGEYDNGSARGAGRTEHIWLPLEDGSAIPVGFHRNGKLLAVHTDHLGTPRLVTDDERRPVWQWPYSAFGNNKPTGPLVQQTSAANEPPQLRRTESIEFVLRFPGQQEDAEAGLSNNLFRWYQSGNGRFTQPDPIGLPGGLNRFIYVENDPLNLIDPSGLKGSSGGGYMSPFGRPPTMPSTRDMVRNSVIPSGPSAPIIRPTNADMFSNLGEPAGNLINAITGQNRYPSIETSAEGTMMGPNRGPSGSCTWICSGSRMNSCGANDGCQLWCGPVMSPR